MGASEVACSLRSPLRASGVLLHFARGRTRYRRVRAPPDRSFADALAAAAQPGPDRSAAFEHLLRPLLFPVRRYLHAQARDVADDLVDEVLLKVFEHLPRFEGTEPQFRSWVFTIAHHQV